MATKKRVDVNADITTTAAQTYMKTEKGKADTEPLYKTRRVQLLLEPGEWSQFQALAHLAGSNPNEMIGLYVHYAITQYHDQIAKYEKQRDLMRQELNIMGDKKNE